MCMCMHMSVLPELLFWVSDEGASSSGHPGHPLTIITPKHKDIELHATGIDSDETMT